MRSDYRYGEESMSPGTPVSRSMRYVGHAALFLELRWHRSGGGRVAAISGTPPVAPRRRRIAPRCNAAHLPSRADPR